MAGHSHAANIFHKKSALDKKRGKIFSKIARKLIVAARNGGADMETNLTLKYAYELARSANMPKDVIQRNIDKGAGINSATTFEEITYEGYGPGGVAVMVEILTDNRNRTAPEVKKIFDRGGGNMGEPGCVGFMFETKAVFMVGLNSKSEDELMELVMAAEADDMEKVENQYMVSAPPNRFHAVKTALDQAGFTVEVSEVQRLPKMTIAISDEDHARAILKLIENLEDNDDVQNVYANHEMDPELLKKLS